MGGFVVFSSLASGPAIGREAGPSARTLKVVRSIAPTVWNIAARDFLRPQLVFPGAEAPLERPEITALHPAGNREGAQGQRHCHHEQEWCDPERRRKNRELRQSCPCDVSQSSAADID